MLGSSSKKHGDQTNSNSQYVGNEQRWAEILRSVNVSELENQIKFNVKKLMKNEVDTNNH